MSYETVAVPFVTVGNRRGLTALQLAQHNYLRDFVRRFPDSFEPVYALDVILFIEPAETKANG